jgi:UDP-glucose 4-epimerase
MKKEKYDSVVTITGVSGFVGSNLARYFLQSDRDVLVFGTDIQETDRLDDIKDDDNFVFEEYDARQPIHSDMLAVDTFYHLSGIANPHIYLERPIDVMNLNIDGVRGVLDRISHWPRGKPRFVFSSTSEVYGKAVEVPFHEDDPMFLGTARRWCYATSKLVAEHYIRAHEDITHTIFRFFNVVGTDIDSLGQGRVITSFVGQVLDGKPMQIVEPGTQTRCFTWIEDAVDALARVTFYKDDVPGFAEQSHTMNMGSDREYTMVELAEMIRDILSDNHSIESSYEIVPADQVYAEGYEDVKRRVPSVKRIAEVLDWEAETRLESFLPSIIAVLIENAKE